MNKELPIKAVIEYLIPNDIQKRIEEFKVPFKAVVPLKDGDSGLLANALSLFGGKKEEVIFKGYLNVTINRVPYKVPIDHKQTINIKLF